MRVGVPKEIKADEYRVGMMPVGAEMLARAGHEVLIERQAGAASGFPDEEYARAGAKVVDSLEDVEWWKTQPAAWEAARRDCREPAAVMKEYAAWLKGLPGRPVFVGYPVAYDFMWVYWYLIRFAGESPFSHSALDIKTLAMASLRCGYRDAVKRNMPREWFGDEKHEHVALGDAMGQGILFCNVLAQIRRGLAPQTRPKRRSGEHDGSRDAPEV